MTQPESSTCNEYMTKDAWQTDCGLPMVKPMEEVEFRLAHMEHHQKQGTHITGYHELNGHKPRQGPK